MRKYTNSKLTERAISRFKSLYLSRTYPIVQIAKKLGISRTTAYRLKKEYFPNSYWNKWRKKMFVKLYESGNFSIDEISGLINISRNRVLVFKREYENSKDKK